MTSWGTAIRHLSACQRGRHRDALLISNGLAGSSLGDDYSDSPLRGLWPGHRMAQRPAHTPASRAGVETGSTAHLSAAIGAACDHCAADIGRLWQSARMSGQARQAHMGEVGLFQSGVRRFKHDAGSVADHGRISGDLDLEPASGGQVEGGSRSARTQKYR